MNYLNKNRITSIVLPFLSFHPTKTTPIEALSPKGERFLIHSSQLKGSSNRLLPVLPTASPMDISQFNKEAHFIPVLKNWVFMRREDKWIAATLLVSSTLFFVTHLYKLMIEDQKQITQTIHQPKHLLSLDSKTSVLIVLALLLKALYALIQAYLQRKNKIPALRLPNQKSFLASNTLYGGIQR